MLIVNGINFIKANFKPKWNEIKYPFQTFEDRNTYLLSCGVFPKTQHIMPIRVNIWYRHADVYVKYMTKLYAEGLAP